MSTPAITRDEATAQIVAARLERGLSWTALAAAVGRSPVWATTALLGQTVLSAQEAGDAAEALGLGEDVVAALQVVPTKQGLGTAVPTDPLLYRFHEITQVYGAAIKELIHEEFGDGIMSAIDFSCQVERVADPAGDRVRVTYNGKFLPYKGF